ncbi:MAG: NAD-dependent epimerase/dehydratase family protein [Bacteroidota bacterium]|nr:NAD(P)-dependent oxidoreductase [Kiloniellaceae bacterium]
MSDPQGHRGCIALTGATGFVGSHLLRRLTNDGWRLRALTRRPEALGPRTEKVQAVVGDLGSDAALAALVQGADTVVHCAGLVAARGAAEFHRVNAEGTARLLRAAAAAGRPRFLLISSLAAREPQLSPYAASKRQAEELLRRSEGIAWQALRPPVVYGPGDRATLPLFRQFGRGMVLRPAGRGRFSMLYVEDLAGAVAALLAQGGPQGAVMELDDGTPGGYGWPEVVAAAERQLGRRIRALPVPQPVQRLAAAAGALGAALSGRPPILSQGKVNEIAHPDWVCRDGLLGDCISWRPAVGLDEGFALTAAWYKAAGWL